MNLRQHKRRRDERTAWACDVRAIYSGSRDEWDDYPDDYAEDPCYHCGGDTMDPDCDYLMPCPVCG